VTDYDFSGVIQAGENQVTRRLVHLACGLAVSAGLCVPAFAQQRDFDFNSSTDFNQFLDKIDDSLDSQFSRSGASDDQIKIHLKPDDSDTGAANISEEDILTTNEADGYEEATLTYRFKFGSDFSFEKQGKLPGLSSFTPHYGGNKDDPVAKDSWSFRQMWLKYSNDAANVGPRPDMYIYDQYRDTGSTGEHYRGDAGTEFEKNTWYTVHMYIKLNNKKSGTQTAQSNGVAELWRDNNPIVCNTGLKFRGNSYTNNSKIGRLALHFYHGGAKTASELPSSDAGQDLFFDYIRLEPGRKTPKNSNGTYKSCNLANPNKPDYP
jgi:hypothetical protein